jgi:hypothetical protein
MAATVEEPGEAQPRQDKDVSSVGELLDRIEAATEEQDPTSLADILRLVGDRSFGPLLLLAGIVMMAPVVGDIPGVPVLMGLLVILAAGQFLLGREHFWMPGWVLKRSAEDRKICKAVGWLRPVARVIDRWSKPRLTQMTRGAGLFVIGVACVVVATATPLMEVVPMSANVAGLAITAFGVALIAADGAVALIAIAFSAATFAIIVQTFLN